MRIFPKQTFTPPQVREALARVREALVERDRQQETAMPAKPQRDWLTDWELQRDEAEVIPYAKR